MSTTMNFLPARKPPLENISLLAVSSEEDNCESLKVILSRSRWTVLSASSYFEAARLLKKAVPDLVVCDRNLPDGSWKDVYREAAGSTAAPTMVVVSRKADERLWAEVLSMGCFDLLLRPFESSEVSRVLHMAARCHRRLDSHPLALAV